MTSNQFDLPKEITYLERRAILAAQPLFRVRQFAELLGWRGLGLHDRFLTPNLISWYSTTDEKFHLQINPHPRGRRFDIKQLPSRVGTVSRLLP